MNIFTNTTAFSKPAENYEANYLLLMESMTRGLHLSTNGKDWDEFGYKFWQLDAWSDRIF